MQATVSRFDAATRSGTVLLDNGIELPYDSDAFDAAGIRLLRLGQRVRIEVAGDADTDASTHANADTDAGPSARRVVFLTIATLPDRGQQKAR